MLNLHTRERIEYKIKKLSERQKPKINYPGKLVDELPLEERYYTFKLINLPRSSTVLAYWVGGLFVAGILAMFLPWQQNIRAKGKVTAFRPEQRPQTVNSTIDGMIAQWYVQEGEFVDKGDTILRLTEIKDKYFDPLTLERLSEQAKAKALSVNAMQEKAAALRAQLAAIESEYRYSLQKARNKLQQAGYKVGIDSADYVAARINYDIADEQYQRYVVLAQKGLISQTQLESREQKLQETRAKLVAAKNKWDYSLNELANARVELAAVDAEYTGKLAKTRSDLSETEYKIADAVAALAKTENEAAGVAVRNQYYVVRAPQSGLVVKALKAGVGEIVKQGDAVVTIMPEEHEPAVELYVRAADVPLLSTGRQVRLEFDGWPALQFSGWPSVAVGTFGGKIAVVDFVNSDEGEYRVLVTQDENDEKWPEQLRVGSGVIGWAMLDEVPIWFEIWRQLNAFPPSLKEKPQDDFKEKKKAKKSDDDDY
jgi:multidrug resistance efflux pump